MVSFYINTVKGWIEIPRVSKVTVPGFEDFDFAVHRISAGPYKGDKQGEWVISEGRSGTAMLRDSHRLQSDAIGELYERLAKSTPEDVAEMVQSHVELTGLSPRWAIA